MFNMILSLLLIFPLVLQKQLIILIFQFFLVFVLTFIRKKRVKLLPSFFITLSLVFFSLLSPFGKVWFSIGKFPITEGAFFLGINKALVLCGMVFISQLATSFPFQIKNSFGKLISEVFQWFNIFSSMEKEDRKKMGLNLKSIDEYILSIYDTKPDLEKNTENNSFGKKISHKKIWSGFLVAINLVFYSFLFIF